MKKNLTFLIYALFIYGTQEKNKENLDISKFSCIFAVMVGQDPHRWAPSKGLVLFSYLWQKFLKH